MVLLNIILSTGTLLIHLILLIFLISIITIKVFHKSPPKFVLSLGNIIKKNGLVLSLLVVVIGTISSLAYSIIIGYEACVLCWVQRVLIFPQVIILGVALLKKYKDVFSYVIGLNVIGIVVSSYQFYTQLVGDASTCVINSVSCSLVQFTEFGYITIPMMSLTTFIVVSILTYYGDKN